MLHTTSMNAILRSAQWLSMRQVRRALSVPLAVGLVVLLTAADDAGPHDRRHGVRPAPPAYDFVDEFDGRALDESKWRREDRSYGYGLERFSDARDLVSVGNGYL